MTMLITEDEIDELELRDCDETTGSMTGGAADHLEKAAIFEQWATDADNFTLGGGVTPAHLLIVAAEHVYMAHDTVEAFRLARAASEHPSARPFEAHPILIGLYLESDDLDAAAALANEVRTGGADEFGIHEMIAVCFESVGEFTLAERWFAIGLRALERVGAEGPEEQLSLLTGRYRVRRAAAKPLDMLDLETEQLRIERGLDSVD